MSTNKTAAELLVWYFERYKVEVIDATHLQFLHKETGEVQPIRFKVVGEITAVYHKEISITPNGWEYGD